MRLSVIICTYNRSESLKRTLEHINNLIIPEYLEWELLVVDNNSKDNTRDVFKWFKDNTSVDCKYIHEKNQGLSFARNTGIQHSTGEIIVFTDDDVIVDTNWVKNISDAFQGNTDIACIGGKILPVWESPSPEWLKGELLNILALCDLGDEIKPLSETKVWGANLSFRSSVIHKYGLFDTDFGHKGGKLYGGEETRYLQTMMEAGEKIMYFPEILVHHCIPEFRLQKKYFRKWYYDKGELFALQMGECKSRNVFGIPLIAIKRALKESYYYIKTIIIDPDNSILCQMSLAYNIGIISGRIRLK